MKNLVLTHKDCYDGHGAAWAARHFLGEASTTFFSVTYGDPVPWDLIDNKTIVYVFDFSFDRESMKKMCKKSYDMLVLDHHKTAEEACKNLQFAIFDMNSSGAVMAWTHLASNANERNPEPTPKILAYVEDRDLWRFKLPFSEEAHAYLSSWPRDFEVWDRLSWEFENVFESEVVKAGKDILRFQNQKAEEMVDLARLQLIGGYEVPLVNCPFNFGSLVAHKLLDRFPDKPFSAYHCTVKDGTERFGFRGRDSDDFDVSGVAKRFGGGGHRKASGMELPSYWSYSDLENGVKP